MIFKNIKNKIGFALFYQLLLCIISILILLVFLPLTYASFNIQLRIISFTGTLAFIVSVYLYYKVTKTFFSPYLVFFTSFFIFQFGQCLLLLFPFNYDYFVFNRFSSGIVIRGSIFTVFSIIMFNLGALIIETRKKSNEISHSAFKYNEHAQRNLGYLLIALSIIPAFYNSVMEMIVSIKFGYDSTYSNPIDQIFILTFLQNLFIPSCILTLVTFNQKTIQSKLIISIVCIYAAILLVVGGRTEGMAIFVTLLFLKHIMSRNINKKTIGKLAVIICLIIILIPTLANFRLVENKSIGIFFEEAVDSIVSNPIAETVGEMGYSISPLFMTMGVIPGEINYQYGESYLASFISIIPSSLDFYDIFEGYYKIASLDEWLMHQYKMDFGPGYSLIAETYYNFGYWGIFVIFLWGLIIGKLFSYVNPKKLLTNRWQLYVQMVCLYSLITLPRRQSLYFVDQMLYLIVLVYAALLIVQRLIHLKSQKQYTNSTKENS